MLRAGECSDLTMRQFVTSSSCTGVSARDYSGEDEEASSFEDHSGEESLTTALEYLEAAQKRLSAAEKQVHS